jgi:hypothetical protein
VKSTLDAPLLLVCWFVFSAVLALAFLGHVLDQEPGVQHQVLGVGGLPRVLPQLEGAPGHHAPQVAAGLRPGAVGAQGLHAQHREQVAFGLRVAVDGTAGIGLNVVAAARIRVPLVDLAIGVPRGPRVLAGGAQVGARPGVVVVPCRIPPAREVMRGHEAVDVLRIDLPAGRVVFDFSVSGAVGRLERADAVREHQPVPAPRMFEVVADAPLLAQPAEEVEVAFVELGLVVAHRVGLGQSAVDGKPVVRQQRIEDLHDRLVLEDPAVGAQGGQVQPGAQRELVLHVAALLAPQRRIGDERVDLAGRRAVELDLAADFPADEASSSSSAAPDNISS